MDETAAAPWFQVTPLILAFGGVVLAALLVWLGAWVRKLFTRPEMYGMTREQIQERWGQIRETGTQGVMGAKLAIMEADILLDSALKSMSMPGSTLGERLRVAGYRYPKIKRVWWAHKLRNHLVHDAAFRVGTRQAQQALDEFEHALKTLNLL